MAIYVNTNVSSLNSNRQLGKATHSLDTTYKRLSSGLRINSAKDDAAGLQISDRLTSQINGLNQGNRNANDGIALAQTAEGALDEVTNMLQRIRTLSLQSANGTNTTADRGAIQAEVNQLCAEIGRISCKTTFAGQQILAGNKGLVGTAGKIAFQVGANANDTISIDLSNAFSLTAMQKALADGNQLTGSDATVVKNTGADSFKAFGVSKAETAQDTLRVIDKYIAEVDKKRGELGAVQNRLESTIANQSNIAENESDARSRIRDTDYAEEAANLSQQTIVQQAASSMLTQANSRPQIALSLLG
ncbi:flagellin [Succinivibrio faecicola]|uniref:Flagellin n=1 Tax=Succinivibrio faecicola TaxID=2820300 RepID=A0ABS7DG04_9GAMM|nr:flagellin [Succinivibrio faecicola]MBW7570214.1 flagellin [Succinivibrio faecicola]